MLKQIFNQTIGKVIGGFIFLFIGIIFFIVSMILGSNFNNIKENGELLKAQVIETYDSNGDMSDSSYTMLEIIDETSFYEGDIVTLTQYSSSIQEGDIVEFYYDGEDGVLTSMFTLVTIFKIISFVLIGLGVILFLITIIKIILIVIAVAALANEDNTQNQLDMQFYQNQMNQQQNNYPNNNYPNNNYPNNTNNNQNNYYN